jgi:NADPH:quinone reductase-like Zn-dependent oxidoreductase
MDGIKNLHLEDVSIPSVLDDDEVLVKISSVALNHRDVRCKVRFLQPRMYPEISPQESIF